MSCFLSLYFIFIKLNRKIMQIERGVLANKCKIWRAVLRTFFHFGFLLNLHFSNNTIVVFAPYMRRTWFGSTKGPKQPVFPTSKFHITRNSHFYIFNFFTSFIYQRKFPKLCSKQPQFPTCFLFYVQVMLTQYLSLNTCFYA